MRYKYIFTKDPNGEYKKVKVYILDEPDTKPKMRILSISAK